MAGDYTFEWISGSEIPMSTSSGSISLFHSPIVVYKHPCPTIGQGLDCRAERCIDSIRMFTGLIQDKGRVLTLTRSAKDARITIQTRFEGFETGESIAVMGACLSVTDFEVGRFTAFASVETLEKTGLGELSSGDFVNLERALKVGDHLGGHLVSGHVDTRVTLIRRTLVGNSEMLTFSLPSTPLSKQIAPKGSVTIDGVSLTVNEVAADYFNVMIIPITLKETTLDGLRPGDKINLETDVLAKYIARQLEPAQERQGDISLELLSRAGFMR